jgi:hypothetical protein
MCGGLLPESTKPSSGAEAITGAVAVAIVLQAPYLPYLAG